MRLPRRRAGCWSPASVRSGLSQAGIGTAQASGRGFVPRTPAKTWLVKSAVPIPMTAAAVIAMIGPEVVPITSIPMAAVTAPATMGSIGRGWVPILAMISEVTSDPLIQHASTRPVVSADQPRSCAATGTQRLSIGMIVAAARLTAPSMGTMPGMVRAIANECLIRRMVEPWSWLTGVSRGGRTSSRAGRTAIKLTRSAATAPVIVNSATTSPPSGGPASRPPAARCRSRTWPGEAGLR